MEPVHNHPLDFSREERTASERLDALKQQQERAEAMRPFIEKIEEAEEEVKGTLVETLLQIPFWQVWRIFEHLMALKTNRLYARHFKAVIDLGDRATEERDRILNDTRWTKVKKWRGE